MADADKTEKPTPKRRREARKEGQVARTAELGQWLSVLVLSLAIGPLLRHELTAWRTLLVSCLQASADPSPQLAERLVSSGLRHAFFSIVVFGGIVMVVSVAVTIGQGGFFLATKAAKPSFAKLNLLKGVKRLVSVRTLWEGAKILLKSGLVALLCYGTVQSLMPLVGGLMPIDTVLTTVHGTAISLVRRVALAALILAAADYAVARRRTDKQLKMTKQQVKDEHKQAEGDPLVKSAIRSRQLAAARNRMMADVATADVLLVNPTHIAIALRYEPERGAPRVVARGAGAIAARIRELAEEARVPTVQDVPLARALYRSCDVGQEIPRELFAAVAQVLAFVISRRARGQYGGAHTSPRTQDELPEVMRALRRRRLESRRPDSSGEAAPSR
jgi:flagellar biosynthesis protein FlhB